MEILQDFGGKCNGTNSKGPCLFSSSDMCSPHDDHRRPAQDQ